MDEITAASIISPAELVTGQTVTLYRCNIETTTTQNEDGSEGMGYTYTEYRFLPGEYEALCMGILPAGAQWNDPLHEKFRQAQHRRADDLYTEASRMQRTSSDPSAWTDYINALDQWNIQVSALKDGYSTDVPEMPVKPVA